jgi:predicted nucleic acid-binding protein
MRVYYDNVVASARVSEDLPEAEMAALREIEAAHRAGTIKRVTSRESWREQERTRDPARRSQLEAARDLVSVVQADHRVIGFENLDGPFGTIATNPIMSDVVDESMFADLTAFGLQSADARHFMYAAANNCQRFVTLDPHFLDRRSLLESRCPSLRVVKPSELAEELRRTANHGKVNTRTEPMRR